MVSVGSYLRSLRYDLPRGVYILQAGLVLNAFGNGAANPFVVLYLHNVRGIPLWVAGLVAATSAGFALASALVAGSVADRRGARATMIGGLVCSAVAFGLYPLVREPWQAFALAALAGTGGGTWLTMQSALLAAITPAAVRHAAFAQQRVAANIGLGLGGFIGGLVVITDRPGTFTVLFLLNAVTFGVYTLFVLRVPVPRSVRPAAARSRDYRDVLADRVFVRFAALNLLVVVGAVSLLNSLFPVYAKNQANVSEHVIGAYFLLNSLVVIVLQMPIVRATEGRRRMRAFALMGVLFAASWLQIAAGASFLGHTGVLLLLGAGIFTLSLAECLHDAVQGPLVSDLAPPDLLGRYMSVMGFSWQLGFIIGPAVGGLLLSLEPAALWPVMSMVCLLAGGYALMLERRLPTHARRNPRRAAAASTDLAPEPAR